MAILTLPTTWDSLFGSVLIGLLIATILYGILCLQCYIYLQGAQKESRALRFSVATIWLLETIYMALLFHSTYWYLVTNFSNILVLLAPFPWNLPAPIDFLVQCWFVYRVWILSGKNRALTGILAILVLLNFVFTVELGIKMFLIDTFLAFSKLNWNLYLLLALDIASSIGIAFSICFFLLRLQTTALRRTQSMVKILMVYAVNTGLLTSFTSIACLVMRLTQKDNLIFLAILLPLCGLYTNALLGSLNARDWFRNETQVIMISMPNPNDASASGHVLSNNRSLPAMTFARRDQDRPERMFEDTETARTDTEMDKEKCNL